MNDAEIWKSKFKDVGLAKDLDSMAPGPPLVLKPENVVSKVKENLDKKTIQTPIEDLEKENKHLKIEIRQIKKTLNDLRGRIERVEHESYSK